jgi:hypothetical protein
LPEVRKKGFSKLPSTMATVVDPLPAASGDSLKFISASPGCPASGDAAAAPRPRFPPPAAADDDEDDDDDDEEDDKEDEDEEDDDEDPPLVTLRGRGGGGRSTGLRLMPRLA